MRSPSDPVAAHLDWYFTARAKGEAAPAEIESHFAPEYRWEWGSPRDPGALEAWFGRWRDLWSEIVDIVELGPQRRLVTTRFGGGGVARIWFEFEAAYPYRILRTATSEAKFTEEEADIARHTAVEATDDGRWQATIHPSFTTPGGPIGGYLAALALRAAGAATDLPVPRSLACHFAHVGAAGPLTIDVVRLRRGRRLESLRVELVQGDVTLLSALVWASTLPSEPAQVDREVPRAAPSAAPAFERTVCLFGAVEIALDPATRSAECRTDGFSADDGPWLHAARLLLPFDWLAVESVGWSGGRGGLPSHQLQTLDTTFTFVNAGRHTPLARATATVFTDDADVSTASVDFWNEHGHHLGRGTQQVLRRRIVAR